MCGFILFAVTLNCCHKNLAFIFQTLFFRAPKSLQMVSEAMKLKDAYSLEEKL